MPSEVGMDGGVDYLHVLRFKGSTLIESQSEQEQFFKVVGDFIKNEDVAELVKGIQRSINGQPARLQFYDDVRRLVPPRLQMEYNLLAPYTSSRVRTVRLLRGVGSPVTGSAIFGFSIRGGREHGTGFFVSEVGGEARAAGLRVGDQILRINGYSVEHAIHQEVIKLIQDSNHLNLKVRSVGMIPVKETDNPHETGSEDGSISSLNSPIMLPSEPPYPLSPTKAKPKLVRKQTPPALTMSEIAALKKIDGHPENGESHKPFQPQLETIPAGRESPPPVATDRRCDPLIWRPVSVEGDSVHHPSPSTTPTLDSPEQPEIIKLPSNCGEDEKQECILNIPRKSTLDCCIWKGPDWHPGIFIQSTKEGGIARDFGLRPGDQIIECNGINFEDIAFSDAVSILKKDKNLNLVIRKGSGTDLFPGSSGYNSSASSVNGDGCTNGHSPNGGGQVWSNEEKERLTTVSEEVSDITPESTLSNGIIKSSNRRVAVDKSKNWDDIDIEWEVADKQQSLVKNDDHRVYVTSCFGVSEESTIVSEEDSIKEVEVKTQQVVAMVHRTEVDDTDGTTSSKTEAVKVESQPCIPEAPSISTESHISLPMTNTSSSTGNAITSLSLSTALSQEIQKRAKRFGSIENDSSIEMIKKRNQTKEDVNGFRKDLLKEIADEKRMQHSKLMEEFKKAHSKMFANSVVFEENETQTTKPEEEIKQRTLETEKQAESSARTQINNQDIKDKKEEEVPKAAAAIESPKPENKDEENAAAPPPPPPPPPMSSSKNEIANDQPQKEKERPVPSPPSTIQKQTSFTRMNSNDSISSQPPSFKKQTSYIRSLSSQSLTPRSPNLTFYGNENNIQIINSEKPAEVNPKQTKHHVSVTISEYPSSNAKKSEPSRFVFLPPNKPVGKKFGESSSETNQKDWNNVNSQLQSELRQTLSRAKLKAEPENSSEDTKQTSKTFLAGSDENNSKSNGAVEMELSPGKQNSLVSKYLTRIYGPEKAAAEILQHRNASNASYLNTDKILDSLANKVTIRVPNTNAGAANKSGDP